MIPPIASTTPVVGEAKLNSAPSRVAISGAAIAPARKANRQGLSGLFGSRTPPSMAVMPAMRPLNAIRITAPRPIKIPPNSEA